MSELDDDTEVDEGSDGDDEIDYIPVVITSRQIRTIERAKDGVPTVLGRLLGAGIDAERVQRHLTSGTVVIDGVRVTDPRTPAAAPARIVLRPA